MLISEGGEKLGEGGRVDEVSHIKEDAHKGNLCLTAERGRVRLPSSFSIGRQERVQESFPFFYAERLRLAKSFT